MQKNIHDLIAHGAVQVTGRFVGEDDLRPADDGPGNGYPLLLPAGKLRREMFDPVAQPDFFQGGRRQLLSLFSRTAAIEQGQLYIVQYFQVIDQVITLKNEAQLLIPELGQLLVGKVLCRLFIDPDLTSRWGVQQAHNV